LKSEKRGLTMKNRKLLLTVLFSIALVFTLIIPASAEVLLPDGDTVDDSLMTLNTHQGNVTPMVAAGGGHIVGLKADGTAVAMGDNGDGQCNIDNWTEIIQIAAGCLHTVGLKANGTVVAAGDNHYKQCNVGNWTDIIHVAAGYLHTVGVKSDGTVVAAGPEVELAKWDLL
jgi:alpha-tubulin suppressor-like RCC1 family protein